MAVVVVEDSSTFLSGVRPRLGDRRLGLTGVSCVTCCTGGSLDAFGDGGRRRLRAGDRDRERDLRLPGDIDLFRAGLRDGDAERERKDRVSFCNTKPRNVRVRKELLRFNYEYILSLCRIEVHVGINLFKNQSCRCHRLYSVLYIVLTLTNQTVRTNNSSVRDWLKLTTFLGLNQRSFSSLDYEWAFHIIKIRTVENPHAAIKHGEYGVLQTCTRRYSLRKNQ